MDEDEYDDDSQEGSESEVAAPTAQVVDPELKKARNENRSLRAKLRRLEVAQKYGEDVAALVPDALPLKEWDGYAEKVQATITARVGSSQTQAGSEAPVEELTEDQKALAAVTKANPSAAGTTSQRISYEQYREMVTDPAQHAKAIELSRAGLVDD